MTMLEVMIVIMILGIGAFFMRAGIRSLTKANLVEDAMEIAALFRRSNQLAIETGELHRVLIDMDKQVFAVEKCQGSTSIVRNELLRPKDEDLKRAIDKGRQKLQESPLAGGGGSAEDAIQYAGADADETTQRAIAIAGHHIGDRMCAPTEGITGYSDPRTMIRTLRTNTDDKFKEIWVQHRDDSATKGEVAVYFFPNGSAEKAVVEITDGDETFSIVVHGLTSRVEIRDGELKDVDSHMMKDALGNKGAKRESQ